MYDKGMEWENESEPEPPKGHNDIFQYPLCSGIGQYHSPHNKNNPQAYLTITLKAIAEMAASPPRVAKESAPWAIFSDKLTRVYQEQHATGLFSALWADIDEPGTTPFQEIFSLSEGVIGSNIIGYTSRSATKEKQKSRLIVPLAYVVTGDEYAILQKILNDKLENIGIQPDRKTEAPGQICYLPNRGEYYEHESIDFIGWFNPETWTGEICTERKARQEAQNAHARRMEESRIRAAKRVERGERSPIDAFNAEYPISLMLADCGYIQYGERWLSPKSESGSPGVTVTQCGQKFVSMHESDRGMGKPISGGILGDAFDLFVRYHHNDDRTAAIKAAGDMFLVDGITITKANQREYMERKASEETLKSFDDMPSTKPGQEKQTNTFSLNNFILNGKSKTMKEQMKADKFILDRMAISGQSTVFYAKPNAGKTLLTIWMIIQAIKENRINGADVFYINADDTFKGLAYKLELAELWGFNMIAPGHPKENPFRAEMLSQILKSTEAHGKILILDTVKKFTDLMRKDVCSKFGTDVRDFISMGGTVIMLAHVNKYKDADNKVVYSGTSDLVDDADCAYTINILNEDIFSSDRTVMFENLKNRGDVALTATYQYNYAPGTPYTEKLNSVQIISDEAQKELTKHKTLEEKYQKNAETVIAIREVLSSGDKNQNDICLELLNHYGISKRKCIRALKDHEGLNMSKFQYWHTLPGDKNAKLYKLN